MKMALKFLKKSFFPFYFFVLGFVSIISQSLILREITTGFYGNEIFYATSLSLWLFWVGAGSILGYRFVKWKITKSGYWLILIFLSILTPSLIFFLRIFRGVSTLQGEIVNYATSLLFIFVLLGFFCFLLGLCFTLGSYFWGRKNVNKAYLFETLGICVGGVFFSLLLSLSSFPLGKKLDLLSFSFQYPDIIQTENTKSGRVHITQRDSFKSFYYDGRLAFTNDELYDAERIFSLIKPYSLLPADILIFGNPNFVKVALEDSDFRNIGFLETDSKLLDLEKDFIDESVEVFLGDPRISLGEMRERWDLVIFSIGNPETLLSNRYFTLEAFEKVSQVLRSKGLFAILLYVPSSYQSDEVIMFSSSLYKALQGVFPFTKAFVLEDQLLFISGRKSLDVAREKIDPKWKDYFWMVNKDERGQKLIKSMEKYSLSPNRDLAPSAFFYQQLFSQTIFSFSLPKIIREYSWHLPFLLFSAYLVLFLKLKKEGRLALLAGFSSFVFISLEVLAIFFFQIKIGFLYNQIALIFASALVGMALGVFIYLRKTKPTLDLGFSFLAVLLFIALFLVGSNTGVSNFSFFWFASVLLFGMLAGYIFAQINSIYLKASKNTAFIYGFDLFGGSLGALLTGTIFLPLFGIEKLVLGLGILVFCSIFLFKFSN